ncbi:putative mycofactocin biosynthesis glycosyltransferase MftF [Abditibacteriota bacterium]|nr:putative mycofactocin biosynthesis glycosyltransferase MftF [Abditibacteriota bacterium]
MEELSKAIGFSIVVPSYNRPRQLVALLASLAKLDYPRDGFEVIVVDDGSKLPLDAVTAGFKEQLEITLVRQKNAGAAAARATGGLHARREFLVFTDDDCLAATDWLSVLAKQFALTPDRLLGGRIINRFTENLFACASHLILDIVYRHFNADPENATLFGSANISMSTRLYREVGGFNPHFRFSEDRELCDRWLFNGYRMMYVPAAVVYHGQRMNMRQFCKQHINYGRGAYHYHQIRAERGSGTLQGETKFHRNWRNLLLFPFTQVPFYKAVPLAGALVLWQFMNAFGFFREAFRQKLGLSRGFRP